MFDYGMPPRCKHETLDTQKIDYFITRLFCIKCGETVGVWEDKEQNTVSGIVRPLTEKEKEDLK